MVPDHGGRLNRAAARYGIPRADWLDLSTGINPRPWPVPAVPESVWQRLPETDDGLDAVARRWSGAPDTAGCLPVAGTQAAIQALPRLRGPGRVGVPEPGYAEHAWWWRQAGHTVVAVGHDDVDRWIGELDVLVWIHPNNPTGLVVDAERLRSWHRTLAARGGWLVLDEAFVDADPGRSLVPSAGPDGLVVLRSVGKFFGLAGLRGGLAFGPDGLCRALGERLGPWAVSHPARWIMARALADAAWQAEARGWLARAADELDTVLVRHGLEPAGGTALFRYCPHAEAAAVQERLARRGILVRRFQDPPALRFGLPPDSAGLARLDDALGGRD
ncbi:threonine-phosphate decarboxylase CobD [Aquisalimonas lutea]|uniref:threonine-phosphate decarboxylase CobD n=1 Tax=Aquisalimonas lutea TaxID=1327750 RepID=UPI0025B4E8AE|nr:threonine-phosphate decarboxylase CobD [Aquisalimonas lutea]MDN3516743.1 threonine-phosphate decarboxylase CobD [Aquisalimonas lutea]